MPRIKITAYTDVEDDDIDDGPQGPLTNHAYQEHIEPLMLEFALEDVEVELVKDGDE